MIAKTTVSAYYNTSPGNATVDQVFLLSIPEVKKYFSSGSARQCQGTKYCVDRGASQSGGHVWWWLRSPGDRANCAALVRNDGFVYDRGLYVSSGDYAVRPALWVNLE